MKYLITFPVLFLNAFAFAQWKFYDITFDTLLPPFVSIEVDTNYPNNKWQIGTPSKTAFTSGYGGPRAMVTDTIFPCVPNDTSAFTMGFPASLYMDGYHFITHSLSYRQSLDLDTGDIAQVEFKNVDTTLQTVRKDSNTVTGWQYVTHNLYGSWGPDPITHFRFTFTTGSSNKHRDGWMLDSFVIAYVVHSDVNDVKTMPLIDFYPNPATDLLHIRLNGRILDAACITLTNSLGQLVKRKDIPPFTNEVNVTISDLPGGVYALSLTNGTHRVTRKINIVR